MLKRRMKCVVGVCVLAMCLAVTGCGMTHVLKDGLAKGDQEEDRSEPAGDPEEAASAEDRETEGAVTESVQEQTEESREGLLCGEWILAGWESEDQDYQIRRYMAEDVQAESEINIYSDKDELYADYQFWGVNEQTIYGMKVVPFWEEAQQEPEYLIRADLDDHRHNADIVRTVTLVSENELWYTEVYQGDEEEYNYDAMMRYVYFRSGSEEQEQMDEWRYRETVTVSTAEELLKEIGPSKKILLEGGIYNFSEAAGSEFDNPNLERFDIYEGNLLLDSQYTIQLIENLCIMPKDGAEVTLCTEIPSAPVLAFDCCNNIVLQDLTCGHEVEPGYCTGSVIRASSSYEMEILDCRLYGSGSYGIEMDGSWDITVENTSIFECTCGLVYLSQVSGMTFKDCSMTNSSGYAMFELNECSSVLWENCSICDNTVENAEWSFVESYDSFNVTFRDCQFKNNSYERFFNQDASGENGGVSLDGCVIED